MLEIDKKGLCQLQIAMKLDEYNYEKSNQSILKQCPLMGLQIHRYC